MGVVNNFAHTHKTLFNPLPPTILDPPLSITPRDKPGYYIIYMLFHVYPDNSYPSVECLNEIYIFFLDPQAFVSQRSPSQRSPSLASVLQIGQDLSHSETRSQVTPCKHACMLMRMCIVCCHMTVMWLSLTVVTMSFLSNKRHASWPFVKEPWLFLWAG